MVVEDDHNEVGVNVAFDELCKWTARSFAEQGNPPKGRDQADPKPEAKAKSLNPKSSTSSHTLKHRLASFCPVVGPGFVVISDFDRLGIWAWS